MLPLDLSIKIAADVLDEIVFRERIFGVWDGSFAKGLGAWSKKMPDPMLLAISLSVIWLPHVLARYIAIPSKSGPFTLILLLIMMFSLPEVRLCH